MWRALSAILLLASAACGDEVVDSCVQQHATYRYEVHANVREIQKSAATGSAEVGASVEPTAEVTTGTLRVEVWEHSSISACHGDLVTESTPGHTLFWEALAARPEGVRIDVPTRFYPEILVPDLYLEVLLDENDNGQCDDGEPRGLVAVPRSEAVAVTNVELVAGPCTKRL